MYGGDIMTQMRQVVLVGERQVILENTGIPKVCPNTVLVRIHFCGICGTDLMNYYGDSVWGRKGYPKYPGHEISGVITEIGADVKNLKVGDRVTAEITIGCGNCDWCKKGLYNICKNR